jgi:hypothetical protein
MISIRDSDLQARLLDYLDLEEPFIRGTHIKISAFDNGFEKLYGFDDNTWLVTKTNIKLKEDRHDTSQ